jgi:hypothetical protein
MHVQIPEEDLAFVSGSVLTRWLDLSDLSDLF